MITAAMTDHAKQQIGVGLIVLACLGAILVCALYLLGQEDDAWSDRYDTEPLPELEPELSATRPFGEFDADIEEALRVVREPLRVVRDEDER